MALYHDEYLHTFSQHEAAERLRALTDYWNHKYHTQTEWDGYSGRIWGRVFGISFEATFFVETGRMFGKLRVSYLAVGMGGKKYLKAKVDDYMNPAHSLEELRARAPVFSPARV